MQSQLANLSFLVPIQTPSWDILIIFVLFATGFFYGIFMGRLRLFATVLSLYIVILLHPLIIGSSFFPIISDGRIAFVSSMSIFLSLEIFISAILIRSLFRGQRRIGEQWWHSFLLGTISMGLFISFGLQLIPTDYMVYISDTTRKIFLTEIMQIIWLLLPLLGILMTRKRLGE